MDSQNMPKDRVDHFGNIMALMPLAYLGFMYFWQGISRYDESLNLVGPDWVMDLGGERTPFLLGAASVLGGIVAVIAGLVCRKGWVVGKGLWAVVAGLVLTGWYMAMTF